MIWPYYLPTTRILPFPSEVQHLRLIFLAPFFLNVQFVVNSSSSTVRAIFCVAGVPASELLLLLL